MTYKELLKATGFKFDGSCRCGGSLKETYVNGKHQVKVRPASATVSIYTEFSLLGNVKLENLEKKLNELNIAG